MSMLSVTTVTGSTNDTHIPSPFCNDPYQIIQVLTRLTKFDQPIVRGAKLTFSKMNNFGLVKTPFRRPRRYEFTDGLDVKIRLTNKKL